ncbi:MAG TPA: M1 family metallopeptidase [Thermoplasmata archaeon]|nr:M1 family metallopeptidase [Thermoplasmata archaeon]
MNPTSDQRGEPPVIPEYRLRLEVDFSGRKWTGSVAFDPPAGTSSLELDAQGLEVSRVTAGPVPLEFRVDPARRKLVLPALAPGPITVDFSGSVSETVLVGLYRSRQNGSYILTSQGEPNGTQRIFPCLDRPDRKSRILLTVRTGADLEVISNGREDTVRAVPGGREWTFAPTPTMSAYLFYLGIGRFDRLEDRSGRVTFRVFTPPGQSASGRFALDAVRKILAAYEEYYGIPYPLPKLDLVAVAEASFGAMENWGAIAFQETRLLVDENSTSFARRDVLETISHEVAHQWFGNLVTMKGWNEIWLNESLAAFLETKICEKIDPAMDARADFYLRVAGAEAAIEGDSLDATHPVRADASSPEEVTQIFDEISYGKGSTLLAMLESYLSEATFRRGLTEYLNRFCYSNASTADLWSALERAAGRPVAPLIDPWLDRPGVPLVTATVGPRGIELTQERFSYHGPVVADPWPIPMLIDVDGTVQRVPFESRTLSLPVPPDATVHLNSGASGFYRVHYDATLRDRLLRALPNRPATDRWIFLEDLFTLVAAGREPWPEWERAVRTLGGTPDRLVVELLSGVLGTTSLFFLDSARIQNLARWFFATQTERLGTTAAPGESSAVGVLRERLNSGRARVDRGYARSLSELFLDWERISPDLRPAVAVARARTEGAVGYRELRRALEGDPRERDQLTLEQALAWSSEPDLVLETAERASSGQVNRGIVHLVLRNACANPVARPEMWQWFQRRLPRLDELFRGAGLLTLTLERTIPVLGLGRGDEVREYFRAHPYPEGARGLAKGLERLSILERLAPQLARAD